MARAWTLGLGGIMTEDPTAVRAAAAATVEEPEAPEDPEDAEDEAVDDIELDESPLVPPLPPLLIRMPSSSSRILSCSIICFSC